MIPTELEQIGYQIQESKSEKRNSTYKRYPTTFLTIEAQYRIKNITKGKQHWYYFDKYQHCFIEILTS